MGRSFGSIGSMSWSFESLELRKRQFGGILVVRNEYVGMICEPIPDLLIKAASQACRWEIGTEEIKRRRGSFSRFFVVVVDKSKELLTSSTYRFLLEKRVKRFVICVLNMKIKTKCSAEKSWSICHGIDQTTQYRPRTHDSDYGT
jgi:hypothetical protein